MKTTFVHNKMEIEGKGREGEREERGRGGFRK